MERFPIEGAQTYLGITLVLVLLVLSAAICGSLVFGYSAYLIFQKQTRLGVKILIFIGLWLLVFWVL